MALDESKFIIHTILALKSKFPNRTNNQRTELSDILTNLYNENSFKCASGAIRSTNLLQLFVRETSPNCLVLNLYPPDEGYAMAFKYLGNEEEMPVLPYTDNTILNYINRGHHLPNLHDILLGLNMFYSDNIIVEIRDYRQSHVCMQKYILLKPTTESIIQEAKLCVKEDKMLTDDLSDEIEAKLALKKSEPLCLNPNPLVTFLSNRVQSYNTLGYPTSNIANKNRRNVQNGTTSDSTKINQLLSLKRKMPRWYDFPYLEKSAKGVTINSPKEELKPGYNKFSQLMNFVPIPNNHPLGQVDKEQYCERYSKKYPQEEYVVELLSGDNSNDVIQQVEILVNKTAVEEQYYGQLFISAPPNHISTSSEFLLGSKRQVDNFTKKFIEVFTEEDIKLAKKTHRSFCFSDRC